MVKKKKENRLKFKPVCDVPCGTKKSLWNSVYFQKPFNISCTVTAVSYSKFVFYFQSIYQFLLSMSSMTMMVHVIGVVLKFETTARETNMFRDSDRDTFVSLMMHTRNCLRPSKRRMGHWKLILKDAKKCSKKTCCGRSASLRI